MITFTTDYLQLVLNNLKPLQPAFPWDDIYLYQHGWLLAIIAKTSTPASHRNASKKYLENNLRGRVVDASTNP